MHCKWKPDRAVCSLSIEFDYTDGIVDNVVFHGGCAGSLFAITKLVNGKPAAEVVNTLSGIPCGKKGTSCPDQLARALKVCMEKEKKS